LMRTTAFGPVLELTVFCEVVSVQYFQIASAPVVLEALVMDHLSARQMEKDLRLVLFSASSVVQVLYQIACAQEDGVVPQEFLRPNGMSTKSDLQMKIQIKN